MKARAKSRFLAAAVAAAIAMLPAAGCDWLKGSDMVRASPFIRNLSISPASVLCNQSFAIGFDYDDPQEDIDALTVTFRNADTEEETQAFAGWEPPGTGLDLGTSGRATYTHSLGCDLTGGSWTVDVRVEDRRGHQSNTLSGSITLLGGG